MVSRSSTDRCSSIPTRLATVSPDRVGSAFDRGYAWDSRSKGYRPPRRQLRRDAIARGRAAAILRLFWPLRKRTLRLPIDPSPHIDRGSFFGCLCGSLTARDDFDVCLLIGKDPPYAHLSVPHPVGELGIHFDPIATIIRFDDHRGSVKPASALDLMTPNEHSGERAVRLVIQEPQPRCDSDAS
jgi:hypothetical protein